MALPQKFCQRMKTVLSEEADDFFEALSLPPSRSFRYDEKKVSPEELKEAFGASLGERVPFDPCAFYFEGEGIGNHPYHHGGALYVQEPCAMAPVAALYETKAKRVLDLCAAPGGKSLQAAARVLEENGLLVSNEPEGKRRRVLMQNLERLGERRVQVTGFDARSLPREWEGFFDLVICDAPCSGEGMLRKSENAALMWSEENVLLCAARQKEILSEAVRVLSPGGRLLYSTCTWAKEENEEAVSYLLSSYADLFLLDPPEALVNISRPSCSGFGFDEKKARRFYPHVFRGEGQFFAVFQKAGEVLEERRKKANKIKEEKNVKKDKEKREIVSFFLSECLEQMPKETLFFREADAFLLPEGSVLPENTVSPGVLVGEVQKGRVVPSHRFFLAYAEFFRNRVMLSPDDSRVEAYLRGEEIALEEKKGYAVLYCGSCPLGGVKISGGRGKNLYPKGLRKV